MFWWTEYVPAVVLWTRPLFLWFAFRFSRVLIHGPQQNARRLLGPQATDDDCVNLGREMVRNFYLSVYELGVLRRLSRVQLTHRIDGVEGRDHYEAARRPGRGTVIVTAHLGAFELGTAALVNQESGVHVVFHPDEHPRFERLRSQLRARLGIVEVPVDSNVATWARLRDALANDGVVLFQMDRLLPSQPGTPVPFGDGHLLMPLGPIKLAQLTGAPILPVLSFRTLPGRTRVVIEPPIEPPSMDERVNGDHPAVRKVASIMEHHIRTHPEQWLMVYPAWREDLDAPLSR